MPTVRERSRDVYRLTLAQLLKMTGQANCALRILDDLIVNKPFLYQAIIQKALVLIRLDRVDEAIKLITETHSKASNHPTVDNWMFHYARGIAFTTLGKHVDAQRELVTNCQVANIVSDEQILPRCAAALVLMRDRRLDQANSYLGGIDASTSFHDAVFETAMQTQLGRQMGDTSFTSESLARLESLRRKVSRSKTPAKMPSLELMVSCVLERRDEEIFIAAQAYLLDAA